MPQLPQYLNANGQVYGATNATVRISGVVLKGWKSIKYEEEKEIENIYAAGQFPIGQGEGQSKFTADLEMYMEDLQALLNSLGGVKLTDAPPVDITVEYQKPQSTTGTVVDTLVGVRFKKMGREVKAGDLSLSFSIPLVPLYIEFGT